MKCTAKEVVGTFEGVLSSVIEVRVEFDAGMTGHPRSDLLLMTYGVSRKSEFV